MVVNKKELEEQTRESFKALEPLIDKLLKAGGRSLSVSSITIIVGSTNTNKAIEWVIHTYSQAGWTVKRDKHYDYRESWDVLNFS